MADSAEYKKQLDTLKQIRIEKGKILKQVEAEREEITAHFTKYGEQMRDTLGDEYLLKTHWAKIELEGNLERRKKQVERLKTAYGQENFRVFRDLRRKFDPKGVLMNELIEGLFESE